MQYKKSVAQVTELAKNAYSLARRLGEGIQWPIIAKLLADISVVAGDQKATEEWTSLAQEGRDGWRTHAILNVLDQFPPV